MRATIAMILTLVLLAGCGGTPAAERVDLPDLAEGWESEPQVAAKIREARRRALEAPGEAAATGRLGMVFHAHDLHAEAVACYDRAAELAPEEVRWPQLAALATAGTDFAASLPYFERAADLAAGQTGPDHAALLIGYGDTLSQLGRDDEARRRYRQALEVDPRAAHALYGLARLDLARDEPEAALAGLERAASLEPWMGEVHSLLAQVYSRLGRPDEAELARLRAGALPKASRAPAATVAAMQAEAVSLQAIRRRGQRLAEQGRFAEAEAEFRRVLELTTASKRDLSNLGGALSGQGRHDEAIALYRQALELVPDDTLALNNLGLALAESGRLDEAAEHLARAVEIDPTYADAHHNLGLTRARQGNHAAAVEHYRAAIAANPSLAKAHNDLGTSLAAGGDLDAAVGSWRRGLEIDGRQLPALYNLALALAQRGEHAEAISWLRRGVATAPNSSRLVALLAWELATAPAGQADPVEAEGLARRVLEAYPGQPQIGDILAVALAAQGRFDEAVEVAAAALEQARRGGQAAMAAQIGARLELYRRGRPYRPAPGGAVGGP